MAAPYEVKFQDYQNDPTPANLSAVVKTLGPAISYSLSAARSLDDPIMQVRAKTMAAQAVQKFDPSRGASLPTWVSSQLRQLSRTRRELQSSVKIPERAQIDSYHLAKSEKEFFDKHNREPDVAELADFSKIPVRRIKILRQMNRRTPSEAAIGDGAPQNETDHTGEALDYVYMDSDHVDRKIIEMKTGYGGAEMRSPKDIAAALQLSPVQLTRRSQRISYKLQDFDRRLQQ